MKPEAAVLRPERSVLVLVDLQEKLLPAIPDKESVLRNSLLLARLAKILEMPIVLTTQYEKGLGPTVGEVLAAAPDVKPLDKLSFGCFGDPGFLQRLEELAGRDQLVLAGVESHICVAQTALGALGRGYAVHVASDAIGSRSAENRDIGLGRMERAGAVRSSAEMVIYELLSRSDGRAFKEMLPHLKS